MVPDNAKTRLTIEGVNHSESEGTYTLTLREVNGGRLLPIEIGMVEAQNILLKLNGVKTPRPLLHDSFARLAKEFSITVMGVVICKYEKGIFSSVLGCYKDEKYISLDIRTSDAVILALIEGVAIFALENVMKEAAVTPDSKQAEVKPATGKSSGGEADASLKNLSVAELEDMLEEAVDIENYEQAAVINEEIKRRGRK